MTDAPTVIVIHESAAKSLFRDAGTFCLVVGIIGVGVLLNSPAMQWCGFLMLVVIAFARALLHKSARHTPQDAADFLAEKFGVRATHKQENENG